MSTGVHLTPRAMGFADSSLKERYAPELLTEMCPPVIAVGVNLSLGQSERFRLYNEIRQ